MSYGGRKYGKLTIRLETGTKDPKRGPIFICDCDCGGETTAGLYQLRGKEKQSCGCLLENSWRAAVESNLSQLVGQVFGRLYVDSIADESNGRSSRGRLYNCICSCGTKKSFYASTLLSGHTRSCGCLLKDIQAYQKICTKYKKTLANLTTSPGKGNALRLILFIGDISARKAVLEVLSRMDRRTQELISMKYGIFDGKTHSGKELTLHFGLTLERLRQIESPALTEIINKLYKK